MTSSVSKGRAKQRIAAQAGKGSLNCGIVVDQIAGVKRQMVFFSQVLKYDCIELLLLKTKLAGANDFGENLWQLSGGDGEATETISVAGNQTSHPSDSSQFPNRFDEFDRNEHIFALLDKLMKRSQQL